MKTYDDAFLLDAGVLCYYGTSEEDEKKYYEIFSEYDYELSPYAIPSIVVVGKPTGQISQCYMSFSQEITVEKVISGTGIEAGECYNIYQSYGFNINENNKIIYSEILNIMNPDSSYLIFLEPSELNGKASKNTYYYSDYFMPYLNLSSDYSEPITKNIEDLKFSDLKESEFFAGSQRILDQIYVIKKKIIKKYLES